MYEYMWECEMVHISTSGILFICMGKNWNLFLIIGAYGTDESVPCKVLLEGMATCQYL